MADRKQRQPKRRSGLMDVLNALLTLLVVAVLVGAGVFLYGAHSFYATGPGKADTVFTVAKGANLAAVGEKLESQGLIDSKIVFALGGWATKKQGQLKAGQFKLTASASMDDILKELTEGKPIQSGVTIPEGWTMAQVVAKLNADPQLSGDLTNIPPEGGILPQTYNFEPGASRQSIMNEMVAAQQKAVAEVWAGRDPSLPLSSPDQLVTLASIVEKETGRAEERPHVAAVFVNRLKKHMRLQSDPTIIYGITKGEEPLGRPLKKSEVEQATAYNTYQIDGLPPGPIANPGIDSLKAAANPQQTGDIYFVAVSTDPADGHLFASTYAQQMKNVAKLRVAQKQAAAADDSDADAEMQALQASQAAASGDTTATAELTPDQSAPADQSPAAAPTDPSLTDNSSATPDAAPAPVPAPQAAAPTEASNGAPIPMPADERPADTMTTPPTGAAPAATPPAATPAPKPVTKPKPKPTTPPAQDAFGG